MVRYSKVLRDMFRWAVTLLAFCLPSLVMASTMSGRVLRVDNGNTVTIVDSNNIQHTVRLQDIQAPGLAHPSGMQSQRNLQEMVGGRHVTIDYDPKTSFTAPTGRVYLGGEDVNLKQIEQGMAKFSPSAAISSEKETERRYVAAQEEAKSEQRGVWYTPNKRPGEPTYERRFMAPNPPVKDAQRNYPPLSEGKRFVYPAAPAADFPRGADNSAQYVAQPERTRAPYGHWTSEPRTEAQAPATGTGSQSTLPRPLRPAIVPMPPYWMYHPLYRPRVMPRSGD